jgi:hypothetical protein
VESTTQSRSQETLLRPLQSRPYDAGEEQMLARPQSKMAVAFMSLSIGVALVSVAATLNRLAPTGVTRNVVWVASLLVVIPLAIAAFNAICDHFLLQVATQRQSQSRLDSYWPAVERDLTNQFRLNGKRQLHGALYANEHCEAEPLAPPTIAANPLGEPAMQRRRQKWWVGQ